MSDWDAPTITISKRAAVPKVTRKEGDINAARRAGAVVGTDKKVTGGTNKAHQGADHQKIAKLDRENEVAPPTKVSSTVRDAIERGRRELKLSQTQLAQKINEKLSVIQDYESGRAIPSPQILGKLERALGVRLRGNNIGEALGGPKKS